METPYNTPDSENDSYQLSGISKKRLKRVGVLKMGIFSGVGTLAITVLLVVPFAILAGVFTSFTAANASSEAVPSMMGGLGGMLGVIIVAPIFYGVVGFIAGVVYAAIYNLIAKLVGGLEFTFEDI